MILTCDLCEKELEDIEAVKKGWLIKTTPNGEIYEVYCDICRVIVCPKGNCND
jgi:hypothetical protein